MAKSAGFQVSVESMIRTMVRDELKKSFSFGDDMESVKGDPQVTRNSNYGTGAQAQAKPRTRGPNKKKIALKTRAINPGDKRFKANKEL